MQVYNTQEVRTALSADANMFAQVNRDFHLLMKATEKNPNVLMCCQRRSKSLQICTNICVEEIKLGIVI